MTDDAARLTMDSITFRGYCLCGSKIEVTSSPPEMARVAMGLWNAQHAGYGHGSATPAEARKARACRRREYAHEEIEPEGFADHGANPWDTR